MTDGQKQFVSVDAITTLQKLEERLQALKDAQSKPDKKPEETTE